MTAIEANKVAGTTTSGNDEHGSKEDRVMSASDGARRDVATAGLDPIASALRRLHDDVVSEPIPDDFMALLASIDDKRESRTS